MNITSTEFQQNVGYYLREAEKGKIVEIKKLKPTRALFKLSLIRSQPKEAQKNSRKPKILDLIKKINIRDSESGLEFQKRVRD